MIYVENDGQHIVSTNYWLSDFALAGVAYLTWNSGAARLLIPPQCEAWLAEMRTAKFVIVSMGDWPNAGKENALEVLFEDDSQSPFCLHIGPEQTDRIVPETQQGGSFEMVVYTQAGEQFRLPGKYRRVEKIPYLKPWVEH